MKRFKIVHSSIWFHKYFKLSSLFNLPNSSLYSFNCTKMVSLCMSCSSKRWRALVTLGPTLDEQWVFLHLRWHLPTLSGSMVFSTCNAIIHRPPLSLLMLVVSSNFSSHFPSLLCVFNQYSSIYVIRPLFLSEEREREMEDTRGTWNSEKKRSNGGA